MVDEGFLSRAARSEYGMTVYLSARTLVCSALADKCVSHSVPINIYIKDFNKGVCDNEEKSQPSVLLQ